MPPRNDVHSIKRAKRIGAFLLWILALAASTVLLFLALFHMLGYSLHHMRIAVCVLVAMVLGLALWGLHARAAGKPRLIFLMKVVLGLLCVSALVIVWSVSTTTGASGRRITLDNQTDNPLLVKIVEIGKRGLLSDNAYTVTLPSGGTQALRTVEAGPGMSFAVVVSEYQANSGAADLSFLGGLGDGISRVLQATDAPSYRAIFPASELPDVLAFRKADGSLVLVGDGDALADEEEDAFALPVPGKKR